MLNTGTPHPPPCPAQRSIHKDGQQTPLCAQLFSQGGPGGASPGAFPSEGKGTPVPGSRPQAPPPKGQDPSQPSLCTALHQYHLAHCLCRVGRIPGCAQTPAEPKLCWPP